MLEQIFHKIRREEISKAAEGMTEAFIDYPLYPVMFPTKNKKKYRRKVYGSFLFWLYTMSDSFYANDDLTCIACMEKPEDKNPNVVLALLKHPWFLIRGVFYDFSIKDFIRIGNNISFSDKYAHKYMKKGDYYFHILCTIGKGRAGDSIFKLLFQKEDNTPIYCETYITKNVRLYELLGFKLLEQASWKGLTCYSLRRE